MTSIVFWQYIGIPAISMVAGVLVVLIFDRPPARNRKSLSIRASRMKSRGTVDGLR